MTDEKKAAPAAAEPRTAKAAVTPTDLLTPAVPVPGVERVVTGKNILTGEPVIKERPVKKLAPDWNTGDRAPYTVHTAVTGSLLKRAFDLKVGDTVNLNVDEAKLFAPYVTKVVR